MPTVAQASIIFFASTPGASQPARHAYRRRHRRGCYRLSASFFRALAILMRLIISHRRRLYRQLPRRVDEISGRLVFILGRFSPTGAADEIDRHALKPSSPRLFLVTPSMPRFVSARSMLRVRISVSLRAHTFSHLAALRCAVAGRPLTPPPASFP